MTTVARWRIRHTVKDQRFGRWIAELHTPGYGITVAIMAQTWERACEAATEYHQTEQEQGR